MMDRSRMWLFLITTGSYALTVLLCLARGLHVDFLVIGKVLAVMSPPFIAGIAYSRYRNLPGMMVILEALLCGLSLTIPIGLSTYLAMGANLQLADDSLVRWDTALGFDWRSFIAYVDNRAWLADLLGFAYASFSFQLIIIPIALILTKNAARTYQMVLNYALICFLSSFIAIWFPAVSAYNVYGLDPASLHSINAYFSFAFLDQFHAVRENPDFVFTLEHMKGIVTFPSVHAAVAVLCAWAGWTMRLLRLPVLVLNILMATSAISHGSHYLVDVVAGLGVAAVVIAATTVLLRRPVGQADRLVVRDIMS